MAKTRSGELFSLLGRSKDSLGKIKRETSFFCPACGEPVILKTGAKKVPHFSHYRHCPVKPEGETETHLLGKKWLFEWLEKQGYRPQLEYFLPDLQQRADVFFERAGKKYALEFQCSPLSLSLLTDRDESYRRSGIIPLWIVLDSRIRKEKGPFFSATDFLSFFIREGPASPFILAFQPDPPMFVKYVHLVPVSKSRFYYQKKTFPLSCGMKEVFRSCPPFDVSELLAVWQREVGRWLIFCHLQRSAKREPALHALYASAIHPTLLPKEVGIPVPRMHAIETHPVLWQALIWLEFFRQRPRGGTFSMEEVKTYLRRSEKTGLEMAEAGPCRRPGSLFPGKKIFAFSGEVRLCPDPGKPIRDRGKTGTFAGRPVAGGTGKIFKRAKGANFDTFSLTIGNNKGIFIDIIHYFDNGNGKRSCMGGFAWQKKR
ncbi:competence protein CoiA [Caldibacillus debilis]|uniref:competence protein CoiA n=1 Tax=Caldibacillus debilis TaxID=301148 RepID=UPI001600F5CF|nr:competence protein CoiA family protein [Caldibacillus debilis]